MKKKFGKVMLFWELYYPIILAFVSFLYSVSLWFSGQKLEGIFVGIWVPSILAASVAIRQRRPQKRYYPKRRYNNKNRKRNGNR